MKYGHQSEIPSELNPAISKREAEVMATAEAEYDADAENAAAYEAVVNGVGHDHLATTVVSYAEAMSEVRQALIDVSETRAAHAEAKSRLEQAQERCLLLREALLREAQSTPL